VPNPLDRLAAALADRYRIERELGQGGMATVYLAEDVKHDRKVALKVLKPELAAVLGADRFVVEIKTTAALQHPHILPLFDSGTADGFLFYVMPFIDGETLRDKLDRETQLGIEEAVRITTDVADALDYAHRHGVVHRDIKPENILLHDGRPMVADFGIALALSAAAGGRMTETGMSLGTPHYMSPEQATADKDVTGRSDIYSLGSVLYEMLTGNPPHVGASAQQIIMKIVTEEAQPVTALRKSVPPNVAAAVARALEKLPADRFASAAGFGAALTNPSFATAPTAPTAGRSAGPPARGPALTAPLAALVVLLAAALGWSLTRPGGPGPVSRYGVALPADQAPQPEGFGAVTPDGSRVLYMGPSEIAGLARVWIKDRDQLTARPLLASDGTSSFAVSPDGARLVVVILNEIRMGPLDGGGLTPVAGGVSGSYGAVTWLDDGSLVYVARDRFALERIPAVGARTPVTVWASDSLFPQNVTPLPDARGVLFQACLPPCATGHLYAVEFGADSARLIVRDARRGRVVDDILLYSETRPGGGPGPLYAVAFDGRRLEPVGSPVVVADSVQSPFGQPYYDLGASGTGIMLRGGQGGAGANELVWVDRAGRATPVDTAWRFLVTQFAADYGWALSPDDTRLAIGLNTGAGDDIWLKQLPRGPVSRVTFGASPDRRPRWRPDGRWITFLTDTSFSMRRADGTGADSLIWAGRADEAVLSADGRWIVLRTGATSAAAGGRDISALRVGRDTVPQPLIATPYDEMSMRLSPNGRWIAYQSDETGRMEVFVRPFPDVGSGKVQVSSDGGTGPLWSRDGREFYYLRRDETMMAVPVGTDGAVRPGAQRELFRRSGPLTALNAQYYTPWDITRDGRFVMTRAVTGAESQPPTLVVIENWLDEIRAMVHR